VYLPTGRRPVSFRARSARVPAHRPQAGFLSVAKGPCSCPPAAGRFPFGREAPVYLPTGRRPVSFRARSAHVPAHRPQAGFLPGAKRPCTCLPAAGRFPFGREAPVYLLTGRRRVRGPPQELAAKRALRAKRLVDIPGVFFLYPDFFLLSFLYKSRYRHAVFCNV
jgi:hypothetical protein